MCIRDSIFADHAAYRSLYAPYSDHQQLDTTWLLKWPKWGRDLLAFLEANLFTTSTSEDHLHRKAVKDSMLPGEVLQSQVWAMQVKDIIEQSRILEPNEHAPGQTGDKETDAEKTDDTEKTCVADCAPTGVDPDLFSKTVHNMQGRLMAFIEETPSLTSNRDSLQNEPLAMIQESECGNVLILFDCNVWGETDSRPDLRACPIHADKMGNSFKSAAQARYQGADPDRLMVGDIFCLIDGGKDRKRHFLKAFSGLSPGKVGKGKDPNKTVIKTIMLHVSEDSWRARRKKSGARTAKLTQTMYLVANVKTFQNMPQRAFKDYKGTNKGDVIGPIELDDVIDIPHMTVADKRAYYGHRYVLAGGKIPADDEDDDENDDEDDDEEKTSPAKTPETVPLSWHCLPADFMVNIATAFRVKHVVDLSPTPLSLAYDLAVIGTSYVAMCASASMVEYLTKQARMSLAKGICDPKCKLLYDSRFAGLLI